MEYVFLGTGAGNGVPEFYCNCDVCLEAISKPECRRTRSASAVIGKENILIDAPPEISAQLLREGINTIDHLFLTHAHSDHTAGLGDLAIYVRFHRKEPLPAAMSRETLTDLTARYGPVDDWLDVQVISPGQTVTAGQVEVTALAAAHAPGTMGYIISGPGDPIAYIPDTGPLPGETLDRLKGISRLALDATFTRKNWYPNEHQSVESAILTAQTLAVGTLYLTHLSMHYDRPMTCAQLESRIRKYGSRIQLAYDGLRLDLTQALPENTIPIMSDSRWSDGRTSMQTIAF